MNIDTTKPSIGRIYDYMLGGHHNFESDRAAAQHMLKVIPSYPTWARLNRWFLQMVAERWASSGHRCILDLGSGMPTQGHFHDMARSSRVLYSDHDTVTVAYAREVIGDNPLVEYIHADVREPGDLLAAADRLFRGERQVAIGFIGVSYFFDDAQLARIMRELHGWAAPGSVMALSYLHYVPRTAESRAAEEQLRRQSAEVFPRQEHDIRRLSAPWRVQELKPLTTWLEVEELVQEADRQGTDAEMYGALLTHEG